MKLRPLAWAAYAVAFLLITLPMVDLLLSVWPLRFGQANWRFGTAGLLSQALLLMLLGMLLALATAALVGHRRVSQVLAGLALAGSALGALAMLMFGLDGLQVRSGVRVEAMGGFDRAAIVAIGKYAVATVTALLMGIGGLKVSRAGDREPAARSARAESSMLLIGADEA
jgi:hypothetical protein